MTPVRPAPYLVLISGLLGYKTFTCNLTNFFCIYSLVWNSYYDTAFGFTSQTWSNWPISKQHHTKQRTDSKKRSCAVELSTHVSLEEEEIGLGLLSLRCPFSVVWGGIGNAWFHYMKRLVLCAPPLEGDWAMRAFFPYQNASPQWERECRVFLQLWDGLIETPASMDKANLIKPISEKWGERGGKLLHSLKH